MPLYQPINYLNELPSETISKGFGLGLDAARTGAQIQQFKAAQAVSERDLADKAAAAERQKQFQNFLSTAKTKEELIAGSRLFPEFQKQIADQFSLESGVERQQMSEVFTKLRVASQNPDTKAGDMALARTIGDPNNAWIWERIGTDPTGAFEATRDRKQFGSLLNVAEMGLLTPSEATTARREDAKFAQESYYKSQQEQRAQSSEQRAIETHQESLETSDATQEKTRSDIDLAKTERQEIQDASNAVLNNEGVLVNPTTNEPLTITSEKGMKAAKDRYATQNKAKEIKDGKIAARDNASNILTQVRELQQLDTGDYTGWQYAAAKAGGIDKLAGTKFNDMAARVEQITTNLTAIGTVLQLLGKHTDSDFQAAKLASSRLNMSNSDEEFTKNLSEAAKAMEKLQRKLGVLTADSGGTPSAGGGSTRVGALNPDKVNKYGGGNNG